MARSKKGFETSIGFIVILIITLVIFASSIAIIRNFFTTTNTIQTSLTTDAQQQIEELLSSGTSVAIVPSTIETSTGKQQAIGAGWVNTGALEQFYVVIGFRTAFNLDDTPMGCSSCANSDKPNAQTVNKWLLYDTGKASAYNLARGERKTVKVLVNPGFQMDDNIQTQHGLYVYNVCILLKSQLTKSGATFNPDTMTTACGLGTLTGTPYLFTGKVYKLQLRVS